jgi:glycosidase
MKRMGMRFLALLLAGLLLATPALADVYYEVFVRAFADSDGDGTGDLPGLQAKLPYLNDLGVEGLWLMPIYPSPSYHGYDVTDYRAINPEYGTMEDFLALLDAAHEKGMRVLIDLPINHSSNEHPWFTERPDWYVWADDEANLKLNVWGANVWKPRGGGHYYAIFWDGMPDLNYDNPAVRAEMINVARYWLDLGVDGFRLDATSHIYGMGEVSSRQEIGLSAQWWREFHAALSETHPDAFLLGEAWEVLDARAEILTGLDAVVNFDVGEAIIPLIKNGGSGANYVKSLVAAYAAYAAQNPEYTDAPFLTNHDQARIYNAVGSRPERAKMAANMLLTLPGIAFLYYGEEIGMLGAKPDEEIRTPMLWGADDPMETSWHASKYNKRTVPVAEQLADPDSLLNHYKKWIAIRAEHPALSEGVMAIADVGNPIVAAYTLTAPEETLLVIHNFTQNPQETSEGILEPYSTTLRPR